MAGEEKHGFRMQWQGRSISVSFEENWLGGEMWHIEIRCDDILPVTETGYRSAFVSAAAITHASEIEGYLLAWLDEAADDPKWHQRLEESRQLKLF